MLQLNIDEFDTLTVICDLLEKGKPETRIAKYLCHKYGPMSYGKCVKFIQKLKLSEDWERRILTRYKELYEQGHENVFAVDDAQNLGSSLRRSAFYARREDFSGKAI